MKRTCETIVLVPRETRTAAEAEPALTKFLVSYLVCLFTVDYEARFHVEPSNVGGPTSDTARRLAGRIGTNDNDSA